MAKRRAFAALRLSRLTARTYLMAEDPLDPATDTGEPIVTDTFTGRRVKP